MDYLSEKERGAVVKFLNDATMREAVRKVILSGVYFDGILEADRPADPLKNFMLAMFTHPGMNLLQQSEKGAKIDAVLNAVSMVETGFREMEKCKSVESPVKVNVNRAR